MRYVEKFANYVDSDEIAELFDKYQKKLGDNRTLAAKECGITPKAVYDWTKGKEGVKQSTKIKILETLLEKAPVETFLHMTNNLHTSSLETLLAGLSSLYEKSFEVESEREYLELTKLFENITREYSGLIHNNKGLEVSRMFAKLHDLAKRKGYDWKPHQTILYDLDEVKQMLTQIIGLWVYGGLPQSAEELAARTKFPLEIVSDIGYEINQQLMQVPKSTKENVTLESLRAGIFIEGDKGVMMSTARALRTASTSSNVR